MKNEEQLAGIGHTDYCGVASCLADLAVVLLAEEDLVLVGYVLHCLVQAVAVLVLVVEMTLSAGTALHSQYQMFAVQQMGAL